MKRNLNFKILVDNLSVLIDSDINYYHHFKIGDRLDVNITDDFKCLLKFSKITVYNRELTIDWDKPLSQKLTIGTCIEMGLIECITRSVIRDNKIDLILK